MKNGDLIAALEGVWDVFVTSDRNLRYQQNLAGRSLAIVEVSTNRWPVVLTLVDSIQAAIDGATKGSYTSVT